MKVKFLFSFEKYMSETIHEFYRDPDTDIAYARVTSDDGEMYVWRARDPNSLRGDFDRPARQFETIEEFKKCADVEWR